MRDRGPGDMYTNTTQTRNSVRRPGCGRGDPDEGSGQGQEHADPKGTAGVPGNGEPVGGRRVAEAVE